MDGRNAAENRPKLGHFSLGDHYSRRGLGLFALAAVIAVAFLADTVVPDGFSGNVLYVVPIILAGALGLGSPYLWAAGATVLSVISSFLAPPGLAVPWEIADRITTVAVLWTMAALVHRLEYQRARARAAQSEAVQANLQKARFLAAASHDLRQPAQSLALLNEVLRQRSSGTGLEQVVEPLDRAITALNFMLSRLMELSSLDAGAVHPHFRSADPSPMLLRLSETYKLRAQEKGLRFRLRRHFSGTIRTDPQFLERILHNLRDNALKHTKRGFVSLDCLRRGDEVIFRVRDSGAGIAPEHVEAIFEEFFQVGNDHRDSRKGLGLGLAVVQRSVQLLGGRVQVRSRFGRGTTFTVRLPLKAEAPCH